MMTIIEGVGDEVIYFVGFAFLVMILVLAWTSTSVAEHALIRTAVLVIDRRRRSLISNNNNTTSNTVGVTNNNTEARNRATNFINLRSVERLATGQRVDGVSVLHVGLVSGTPQGTDNSRDPIVTDSSGQVSSENSASPSTGGGGVVDIPEVLPSSVQESLFQNSDEQQLRHRNVQHSSEQKRSSAGEAADVFAASNDCFLLPSSVTTESSTDQSLPTETSEEQFSTVDDLPPTEGNIRVRIKFLNDTQRLVEARLLDQLGDFKRRHFGEELGSNKIVRLIFNGQLLQQDQETLQFYGLFDNCVVHCHISSSISSPSAPVFSPRVELDLSRLMLPLFGLILGLIWCCRIQYRQYFTGTSTFALVCITGLFVMSIVALWLPTRAGHARG